jgi:hypothetical protein
LPAGARRRLAKLFGIAAIARRQAGGDEGRSIGMRSFRQAVGATQVALLGLLAVSGAQAETIYKCRSAAGTLSYSSRPCPQSATPEGEMDYPAAPASGAAATSTSARPAPSTPAEGRPAGDGPPPRDAWPPREDMHDARARAAADEERAAAEKARQAEMRKHSNECVHIRARLPMGYWASEGCM